MSHIERMSQDVTELLKRTGENHLVQLSRNGQENILATAMAIPTLAERGFIDQALQLAQTLAKRRDPDGGWDDPWTTVLALEAYLGLALRGISFTDRDAIIDQAILVLKGSSPLENHDRELRLGRAIVLAGLAKKSPQLIDFGLLRARSAIDKGWIPNANLSEALHGLLALTDINYITKDLTTNTIILEHVKKLRLTDPEFIAKSANEESLARIGVILEKLDHRELALKYYDLIKVKPSEKLDTSALKHRLELAARLFRDELESLPTLKPVLNTKVLPAEKNKTQPSVSVSAIVIQNGSNSSVAETLKALNRQTFKPIEIVLVEAVEASNGFLLDVDLALRRIHPSRWDTEGKRWQLGASVAAGNWLWMLPSGIKPQMDVLSTLITGIRDETSVVHLSEREGDLATALVSLQVEPSIPPERMIFKSELLDSGGFSESLRENPFWEFILRIFSACRIEEVVVRDQAKIIGASKGDLFHQEDEITDRNAIYQLHKSENAEIRANREKAIKRTIKIAYDSLKNAGRPLVSIVIPHYDLPEMLQAALESIIANTEEAPFEVIVVDNGSKNTDEKLLAQLDEWGVLLLRNQRNEGFAKACNRGVEAARGKYILLLNNDTEVQKGWLSAMVRAMQEEPEAGIVGARLLFPDGTLQHVGITFSEDFLPGHIYSKAPSNLPQVERRRFYQAVTGACMLIRKELYEKLNGLDESFLNGFEDIDFCLRARQEGAKVIYEPDAIVIHHCEQTPGRKDHDAVNIERFLKSWAGEIEPDFHLYAQLDGFRIEERNGKKVMISINQIATPQVRKEAGSMEETTMVKQAPNLVNTGLESEQKALNEMIKKADVLIKEGQFNDAERLLLGGQDHINGNLRNRAMFWTLLGDARFRLDRPEEALQCYQKAVSADPSAERAWIGIGAYKLIHGELEQAEDIFSKIVTLSPQNSRGFMGLGNVNLKRGNHLKALEYFKEAARLAPDHRPAIVGLVASAVQAGRMNEAQFPLEQYLNIKADDIEARFHLAAILFGSQDTVRAREEAEKVLRVKPNHRGAKELMNHLGV